jgi:hypothetical protein
MILVASRWGREKLEEDHGVTFLEAEEAFASYNGCFLVDNRTWNVTKPPTVWFISETFDGRLLKLVVKFDRKNGLAFLRTAYEPSEEELALYEANE